MTNTLRTLRTIALIASCGLVFLPISAHAQFIGFISPQTVSQSFSNSTCNGTPQNFVVANLGQSVHFVTYSTSGLTNAGAFLRVYMLPSASAASTQQISDTGTDTTGGIITANGYYSNPTISVICGGGSSPNVTISYFGTSANSVPTTGIQDQSAWFKQVISAAPENTTATFASITAPYGNSCGQLLFSPQQGSNTGTLTVQALTSAATITAAVYPVPSANSLQIFNVPCQPAENISITYTTAAGSGTFYLYYLFYKPGFFPNLTSPNSGTSATLPIQVVSDGVSQAFFEEQSTTNPAGTSLMVLHINDNNASKTLYLDKAIISCTAACAPQIQTTSTLGTTCSAPTGTLGNQKVGSAVTSVATLNENCTGAPTVIALYAPFNLAANTSIIFDLRGLILPAGTTDGAEIGVGAFTGTITATFSWYEK